mmetsp:Transcript_6848/g.20860  ORF Transcript_6848/g.20860 Transcript_6848/m.20860 type:complete len:228 (-) Transcript_6848:757-1440(-)
MASSSPLLVHTAKSILAKAPSPSRLVTMKSSSGLPGEISSARVGGSDRGSTLASCIPVALSGASSAKVLAVATGGGREAGCAGRGAGALAAAAAVRSCVSVEFEEEMAAVAIVDRGWEDALEEAVPLEEVEEAEQVGEDCVGSRVGSLRGGGREGLLDVGACSCSAYSRVNSTTRCASSVWISSSVKPEISRCTSSGERSCSMTSSAGVARANPDEGGSGGMSAGGL